VVDRNILKYELKAQLKQAPNDKAFLFFKPRLWLYYRQQEKGDTTDFDLFVSSKLAEPPSIYDTISSQESAVAMREHLFNRGYLQSEVQYADTVKNKKVTVTYHIEPHRLFTIESYDISAPDQLVDALLQESKSKTFLRPGEPVSSILLYNEKQRIISDLQKKGFANLSLGNFSALEATDTTNGTVQLRLRLLPGQVGKFDQKYVGNVVVNNRFKGEKTSFSPSILIDSIQFINFNVKNQVKPSTLLEYIKLRPGNLFRKEDLSATRTQLQIPAIQFADITTVPRKDSSNVVDFQIDLLPAKRIESNLEFELNRTVVSSESFVGLGTNVGLINNNLLGGSERLSNILDISFEVDPKLSGIFNAANVNFSNTLEIPRYTDYFGLYKGLKRVNLLAGETYDRLKTTGTSVIDLSYEYVDLFAFFNYHSITAEYGFRTLIPTNTGRKRIQIIHPSLTYFNPTTKENFDSIYAEETFARKSFEPQLFTSILFSNLAYSLERIQGTRGYSSALISSLEISGAEVYLANAIANGGKSPFELSGLSFSQFAKFEIDGRLYKKMGGEQALAFRANVGVASAFGTSDVVPFVRQFYLGGPLSMRGWRIRELGPGSYQDTNSNRGGNDPFFQTGDLKLLLNAEYRFDIFWRIEGALFVDAGNIWAIKKDEREGAEISADFINQIAIGSGAGMRFDADYFKVILDVGVKLRNPYPDETGSYSALKATSLNNKINWNFSINYPF